MLTSSIRSQENHNEIFSMSTVVLACWTSLLGSQVPGWQRTIGASRFRKSVPARGILGLRMGQDATNAQDEWAEHDDVFEEFVEGRARCNNSLVSHSSIWDAFFDIERGERFTDITCTPLGVGVRSLNSFSIRTMH